MNDARMILIAEVDDGRNHPAVLELAGLAVKVGASGSSDIRWVVVGRRAAQAAKKLAAASGYPAIALDLPRKVSPTGDLLAEVLQPCLEEHRPDIVAGLHTFRSQEYMASLSLALEAACFTGVQGVVKRDGDTFFQRAVFGGKCLSENQSIGRPVILTVLPGYFSFKGYSGDAVPIEIRQLEVPSPRTRLIEALEVEGESSLRRADTIVAAGRGVGSREKMADIHRLAALLPKSAVAGSRTVCDAGWLPYRRQVGVTGATVAPELYLACGISGAYQHIAGMSGARFVVAINNDPHAAIFRVADVGVVENLNTFLPRFVEALEDIVSP